MAGEATWLSVIMPTFNGERFVREALESVATQDASGVELLVVDDGSRDRTLEIVSEFSGRLSIRNVPHRAGGNWVRATNAGLRAATGSHACILHQDDAWLPGRLSKLRQTLERDGRDVGLILHPARFIGHRGESLGAWDCPLTGGIVDPDEFVGYLLVQNFIAIPSPVFRTERALSSGGLDESLWYTADWDLWLRLGAAGPVRYLPEPLAAFRIHPQSQTIARRTTFEEIRSQMVTVLERHLETWPIQGARRRRVERVARFSVDLNATLAARARGQPGAPAALLLARLLATGPSGCLDYFRNSRIVERTLSRMRLRLHRAQRPG